MITSFSFLRVCYILLSVLLATSYVTSTAADGYTVTHLLAGVLAGTIFGLALISTEMLFKKIRLRSFNVLLLGLGLGLLMGQIVWSLAQSAVDFSNLPVAANTLALIKLASFLVTTYAGIMLTAYSSDELYLSIPFVRFKQSSQKKKDILLDASILTDPRLIDLANSRIVDSHLVLPKFIVKDLQLQSESADEIMRNRARKSLEVIKKLEGLTALDMRYVETDYADIKDIHSKLTRLARHMDSMIMSADQSRIQQSGVDGVPVININTLSNALKPLNSTGEQLTIKIQRYGKEPRQGVGYLEDGTMVVVNGGAEFIGETIKTQVLSVKHTSSGRMIFCNTAEESAAQAEQELQESQRNYFSL